MDGGIKRWKWNYMAHDIKLADGADFNVNTNKFEGLWAHLKHKTKRIYGTSIALTESYMHEQLFRMNARAKEQTIIEAFVKIIRKNYPFDNMPFDQCFPVPAFFNLSCLCPVLKFWDRTDDLSLSLSRVKDRTETGQRQRQDRDRLDYLSL
jgi:hypothetical protein